MTEVATLKQSAIVPKERFDAVKDLAELLKVVRGELAGSDPMIQAIIQARAIGMLEKAITEAMLDDFKWLMDSPLGFKTDRPPGSSAHKQKGPYNDLTIKRVVIVALLAGCQLTGNEFNIISGQFYCTKERKERMIKEFSEISNFRIEIGQPTRQGSLALFEAKATWKHRGLDQQLVCHQEGDVDNRIAVKCYETSGIDQLKGLAESKLYSAVIKAISGVNIEAETDYADVIEGESTPTTRTVTLTQEVEPEVEPAPEPEIDSGFANWLADAQSYVAGGETLTEVKTNLQDRIGSLDGLGLDDATKSSAKASLNQAAEVRKRQIRSKRK